MKKLYDAFSEITPDRLDKIHEELQYRDENITINVPTRKKKRFIPLAVAFLAVILVVCSVTFYPSTTSTSSNIMAKVDIDVNPSVEFSIDENNKIVEATANNEDGENILGDMDFTGSDIEVGINAIIGSMLMQGYIDELKNSLLVSVIGDDEETNEQLREQLTTMIDELLQSSSINGSIISLTLTDTSSLEDLAEQYGISVGKAEIIQKLIEFNSHYSFETLKDLTIHDLNILLENYNVSDVTLDGNASVSEYIGEDKAKIIALNHAGVSESNISGYEIEMDYEDGVMVYEIEFKYNNTKYEYEINALDGTIIEYEPLNISSSSSNNSSSNNSSNSSSSSSSSSNSSSSSSNSSSSNSSNSSSSSSSSSSSNTSKITKEKSMEIAFNHAGVSKSDVDDLEVDYDDDDNVYEVEFKYDHYEYEYEINASNGNIADYEKEYHH